MNYHYPGFKFSARLLLGLLIMQSVSAQEHISRQLVLIAHRGGIVDSLHAENSLAAASEAIRRGYLMLEVDLRETADGRAILQHDADFNRYYNHPGLVAEMTWDEIKALKSSIDGTRPMLFSEAAAIVAGKAALMLDIKGNDYSDPFYREVGDALREYGLMESTFILGGNQAKMHFPEASHSTGFDNLIKAAENGEDVSRKYHLFMLASQLDQEMVRKASDLGVTVVAAVNVFRYRMAGQDVMEYARRDIERLLALNVRYFQIDSVYEPFFKK
jgi:hypothetical protein